VVSQRRDKKKSIHHITRHIWLRLLYKRLHPYLPPLRYGKHQICRNVRQNRLRPLRSAARPPQFCLTRCAYQHLSVDIVLARYRSLRATSPNSYLCEIASPNFAPRPRRTSAPFDLPTSHQAHRVVRNKFFILVEF
jgi:hypothetical protein